MITEASKNKINETLFFLIVGSFLAWSFFLAIVGSTELTFNPLEALMRIIFVMAILRLIFWNKWTVWATLLVIIIAGGILLLDSFWLTPRANYEAFFPRTSALENMLEPMRNTISYMQYERSLTPTYDSVLTWGITIALAIFVLIFGFLKFNFYALLIAGIIIFSINLNFGSFFYNPSFYLFVSSIVAYLIKHLNGRNLAGKRIISPFSLYAIPITVVCLIVAAFLPTPPQGTADNFRVSFIERPFNAVGDMINAALHPTHFSLAQTGFGGGGQRRLGGNVRPNDNRVMRIQVPQFSLPMYLAGAVFDEYTGSTWENTFTETPPDFDIEYFQFAEAFELALSGINLWMADDFFEFIEYANATTERHEMEIDERVQRFIDFYGGGITSSVGTDGRIHFFTTTAAGDTLHISEIHIDDEVIDLTNIFVRHLTSEEITLNEFNNRWARPGMTIDAPMNLGIEFAQREIILEHEFRSVNVFTTGLTIDVLHLSNAHIEFVRDVHGMIRTNEVMNRNDQIEVLYAEPARSVNTSALARASYRGILRDAHYNLINADEEVLSVLGFINLEEYIYELLIPRADWIFEAYTQLPDELPARIGQLAQHVTQGATNDYERAGLLNEFLRTSFPYTLSPGNTPSDRDFVDYFLFDQQEGYCVHFATAFVVMARTLGLAARYVEGFYVTGFPDDEGFVNVINRQGHAWAQVYFEGFGWKIFEPTPAGAVFTRTPNAPEPTTPLWMQDMDMSQWGNWEAGWDEYDFSGLDANGASSQTQQYTTPYTDGMYQNGHTYATMQEPLSLLQIIILATLIAFGLFALVITARHVLEYLRLVKIKKMPTNQAAIAYFNMLIKQLERFDYFKKDEQTPLEFAKTIAHVYEVAGNNKTMTDMANMMYIAKYSTHTLQKEDLETMQEALVQMDKRLRENIGFLRHAVYKLKLKV